MEKDEIKAKLEQVRNYANKIDKIWFSELEDKTRDEIDDEFNTPISEHIRWLLTDIEDVLEIDF